MQRINVNIGIKGANGRVDGGLEDYGALGCFIIDGLGFVRGLRTLVIAFGMSNFPRGPSSLCTWAAINMLKATSVGGGPTCL